jgi:hypothetical protein
LKDTWYGDNRDIVKWGTLAHLAQKESITTIVQVPFLRAGSRSMLETKSGTVSIHSQVWDFFRSVSQVERLGERLGCRIVVFGEEFRPADRRVYRQGVVDRLQSLAGSKIVLLDPDTGIAPSNAGAEHVTQDDIKAIWESLSSGDWLVVYQHAARTSHWLPDAVERLSRICSSEAVEVFSARQVAWDVAFLAVSKHVSTH